MKKLILLIIFLIVFSIFVSAVSLDINDPPDNLVNTLDRGILNNNLGSSNMVYDLNSDKKVDQSDMDLINNVINRCEDLQCYCSLEVCESESDNPTRCNIDTIECDDSDNDGVYNDKDQCPDTPEGEKVNAYGCSDCQTDKDDDGVMDCNDDCPTEFGYGLDGCPSDVRVSGDTLIIPYGDVVYSSWILPSYINIYIYGQLDVIPLAGFQLISKKNFIFYGEDSIINARGDINEPGKEVNLKAGYFEIEEQEIICIDNVKDTLEEGTTKTYTLSGIDATNTPFSTDYQITPSTITPYGEVIFIIIAPEVTNLLKVNSQYTLSDDSILKVLDVFVHEAGEAAGGDKVTFTITQYGESIQDTLEEGTTKTYTLSGIDATNTPFSTDYQITPSTITPYGEVIFIIIAPEVTNLLKVNSQYTLSDDSILKVLDVFVHEAGEAAGGDKVTFTITAEVCTYSDLHQALINKHILREANDGGITKQCTSGDILTKPCGYCGNRIKDCTSKGIWPLGWSSCEDQGYCEPGKEVPDVLIKDIHREGCELTKSRYVQTLEQKECGNDCSYQFADKVEKLISLECNAGYCDATCTTSTNEECGRCGTSTCDNCIETCNEPLNACTPGTKTVSLCQDCNRVKYQNCGSSCQWEEETACTLPITEPGCESSSDVGKTKTCGYCGTQTCTVTCAQGEDPHYYWSSCTNEYNRNDKCLAGQKTEKLKETKREICDGNLVKYVDVYQQKLCPDTCELNQGTWTGNEILKNERKVSIKGKCGYECDNGQKTRTGSDTGYCQSEIKECQNNKWVIIQNRISPLTEVCNDKIDNNCDGQVDEDCTNVKKQGKKKKAKEECCNCGGDPNLDFKSFYEFNRHVCYPNSEYNTNADFNGDGCVGVPESLGRLKDKSFGGGFRTIGTTHTYYSNPDFDCFEKKYTQTCTGCPDLNGDGVVDVFDFGRLNDKKDQCNVGNLDLDGDDCIYNMLKNSEFIMGDYYCVNQFLNKKASDIAACGLANNIECTSNNECQSVNCIDNVKEGGGTQGKICCDNNQYAFKGTCRPCSRQNLYCYDNSWCCAGLKCNPQTSRCELS